MIYIARDTRKTLKREKQKKKQEKLYNDNKGCYFLLLVYEKKLDFIRKHSLESPSSYTISIDI